MAGDPLMEGFEDDPLMEGFEEASPEQPPISIPGMYDPGATQSTQQPTNPVAALTQATADDAVQAVQALPVQADQFGMPATGQSRVTQNQVEAVSGSRWAAAFKRAAQRRTPLGDIEEKALGVRNPVTAALDLAQGVKSEVLDKEVIEPFQEKQLGAYNIEAKKRAEKGLLTPRVERIERGLGRLFLGDKAQAQMDPLRQRQATRSAEDTYGTGAFGEVANAAEMALTGEASMLPTYMVGLTGASAAKLTTRFGTVAGSALTGGIEGVMGETVTPGGDLLAGAGMGTAIGGVFGKIAKVLDRPKAVAAIPKENIDAAAADLFHNTPDGDKVAKFSGVAVDLDETGTPVAKILGEAPDGTFVAKTVPLEEGLAIADRHKVAAVATQRMRDSLPDNVKRVAELTQGKSVPEKADEVASALGVKSEAEKFAGVYGLKYDRARDAILDPTGVTVLADSNGLIKLKADADPAARRAVIRLQGLVEAQVAGKKVVGKPLALGDGNVQVTPIDGGPAVTVPEGDLTRGVMGPDEWGGGFTDKELNTLFQGKDVGQGAPEASLQAPVAAGEQMPLTRPFGRGEAASPEAVKAAAAMRGNAPAPDAQVPSSPDAAGQIPLTRVFGGREVVTPNAVNAVAAMNAASPFGASPPAGGGGGGGGGGPPKSPPAPMPTPEPLPPRRPQDVPMDAGRVGATLERLQGAPEAFWTAFKKNFAEVPGLSLGEDVARVGVYRNAQRAFQDERVRLRQEWTRLLGRNVSDAEVRKLDQSVSDFLNGHMTWEALEKAHPDATDAARKWVRGLADEYTLNTKVLESLGFHLTDNGADHLEDLAVLAPRLFWKHQLPDGEYAKWFVKNEARLNDFIKYVENHVVSKDVVDPKARKERATRIAHEVIGTPGMDKTEVHELIGLKDKPLVLKERMDLKPDVDRLRARYKDDPAAMVWLEPLVKARLDKNADIKPVAQQMVKDWTAKLRQIERDAIRGMTFPVDMPRTEVAKAVAARRERIRQTEFPGLPPYKLIKDVRQIASSQELSVAFRRAMGEIDSGSERLAYGIAKQRVKIAQAQAFRQLAGTSAVTTDPLKAAADPAGWVHVTEADRNTVGGALVGSYVRKDVWQEVIQPVVEHSDEATRWAQRMMTYWRRAVTVGNVPSLAANAAGNVAHFHFAGGNPWARTGALREAFGQWWQHYKNPSGLPSLIKGDPSQVARRHQLFERLRHYNLTQSSFGSNELNIEQKAFSNEVLRRLEGREGFSLADLWETAGEWLGRGANAASAAYSIVDPISKHLAWLDNLVRAGMDIKSTGKIDRAKAQAFLGPGVDVRPYNDTALESLVMDEAAVRVMNSFPLHDRQTRGQNILGKLPFVDFFATNTMQQARVWSNLPNRWRTEPGFKNSVLRLGLTLGAVAGAMKASSTIADYKPEELAAALDQLPESDRHWSPGLEPIGLRDARGKPIFVDPWTPMLFPLQFLQGVGLEQPGEIPPTIAANAIDSIVGGFVQDEVTGIRQAAGIPSGPVFRQPDPRQQGMEWILQRVEKAAGVPAAARAVPRALRNAGVAPGIFGEADQRRQGGQGPAFGTLKALFGTRVSAPVTGVPGAAERAAQQAERRDKTRQ